MTEDDLKVAFVNTIALVISFAELELWFKIALMGITIGYTITKWVMLFKDKNGRVKNK
jgi:proteasome assembly chaperone (PAC2) family protein